MPSKKAAPKKEIKIEEVAAKTVDDITADLVKTQNQLRGALTSVGDALIAKREQLSDMVQAIEIKQDELNELIEKEKVILALQELKEELEDAKHEHERKVSQLEVLYEDKSSELLRNFQRAEKEAKQQEEDAARERRIALEDEDLRRQRQQEEIEFTLTEKGAELDKRATELGDFEKRVEQELDRRIRGEKVRMSFESQALKKETEAAIKILEAQVEQLKEQNSDLGLRLVRAEGDAKSAAERANEVVIQSLEAGAGTKALEEVRAIAQRQAESGRK